MTAPDQQPHPVDMWAICDPQGNIMDSTVMLKQKDAIYNGTVWGRCGDDRTLADFKREGYRVIRVHVVPFSAPKNDPAAIAAAARAEAIIECRKIVGDKVISNKCPFNGDCAQCFLCDNAGGCIVRSDEEIAKLCKGARAEERELLLDKFDYFVCSCQELHAPDCNGSEEGIKDCDGCGMFESATIEQIREYIKELR